MLVDSYDNTRANYSNANNDFDCVFKIENNYNIKNKFQ